jgi:UDP-N-acetylmuramoylalanine--D-glutamate ligase
MDLNGRIAVLGLGRSGEAVVDWALARPGKTPGDVVVFVEHDTPELREAADRLAGRGVRVVLGASGLGKSRAGEAGFSLIVSSPGIAPHRPLLAAALGSGVPVISELELAYQVADVPMIAVTGTNGKTTTTALIAHLLRGAGLKAEAAGNIGRPALDAVRRMDAGGVLVVECSSFQLALTLQFRPRVAVLLNVTPDHIDWHGSFDAYAADKARVFANQGAGDVAIVDVDDVGSAAIADELVRHGADVVRVSVTGAGGAHLEAGRLVLDLGGGPVPLVRADELLIPGAHNTSNALAAAAAAVAFGARPEDVKAGLRTFAPIEHRLEPVAMIAGVRFVNDSKATNPDAVLKALTAFGEDPIVVLLGGRNKGSDFAVLARACAARCRLAVLYGEALSQLEPAFQEAGAPFLTAGGMLSALDLAASEARPGEVVLLSPACASFDEFRDYEDRGETFSGAVRALEDGAR